MATSSRQNYLKRSEDSGFQVPTASPSIHAGDLLVNVGGLAAAGSAQTGAQFIGVAETDSVLTVYGTTQLGYVRCKRRGVFRFFSTSGDTYSPYDLVYFGTDAQTVTKVSTTSTLVGYVDPEQFVKAAVASGLPSPNPITPIAGGSGVLIDVHIKPNYPVVTGAQP